MRLGICGWEGGEVGGEGCTGRKADKAGMLNDDLWCGFGSDM